MSPLEDSRLWVKTTPMRPPVPRVPMIATMIGTVNFGHPLGLVVVPWLASAWVALAVMTASSY